MAEILDEAKNIEEFLMEFQQDLHENPELSGEEYRTREKVMLELDVLSGVMVRVLGDAYEIKVEVAIEEGTPSLYNDEALCRLADISCTKVFGPDKNRPIKRLMGSEDMPFYFQHAPGIYAFLGYRNEEKEAIYLEDQAKDDSL